MNLTPNQKSVLLVLSTDWQTPIQIAGRLSRTSEDLSNINQALKDLIYQGWVQVNPVILGMYRLTSGGFATKALELSKSR